MVIALAANFPVIMQNIICEMPREQAGLRSHLRGVLLATRTLGKELRARTPQPSTVHSPKSSWAGYQTS